MFSPFNLEHIDVRYQDKSYGQALPHHITRHAHPKARPETTEPGPVPATGIDYLAMVADTHHHRVGADDRINFDALYPRPDGQLPGQLSIDDILSDDILAGPVDPADMGEATA